MMELKAAAAAVASVGAIESWCRMNPEVALAVFLAVASLIIVVADDWWKRRRAEKAAKNRNKARGDLSSNRTQSTPPIATGGAADATAGTGMPIEEAERIRATRLQAEAALKQYALALTGLYVLMSAAFVVALFVPMPPLQKSFVKVLAASLGALAAGSVVVNWGVRRLAAWTRIPLLVLCMLARLIPHFGRVVAREILREIQRGPQPRLLSREYECIVEQTSHMTERTSVLTWIALALICLLVALAVVIARLPPEVRHLK